MVSVRQNCIAQNWTRCTAGTMEVHVHVQTGLADDVPQGLQGGCFPTLRVGSHDQKSQRVHPHPACHASHKHWSVLARHHGAKASAQQPLLVFCPATSNIYHASLSLDST